MRCPSWPAWCATREALVRRQDRVLGERGHPGYVMYRDGQQFYGGDGIVKKGVENTIDSIARLGRDGMRATNDEIIRIMLGA